MILLAVRTAGEGVMHMRAAAAGGAFLLVRGGGRARTDQDGGGASGLSTGRETSDCACGRSRGCAFGGCRKSGRLGQKCGEFRKRDGAVSLAERGGYLRKRTCR